MDGEYWDDPDIEYLAEDPDVPQRDAAIDDAKGALEEFFREEDRSVFYQRQLQVIFEGTFFHWITAFALSELASEGRIASERVPFGATGSITLYRATTHRYWRRQANELIALVTEFSEQGFTKALGAQGEMMFDAGLAGVGFIPVARNVRSYRGVGWTETGHDLDRVYERDGIAYGAEIKNTLSYIERYELTTKMRMCTHLGLRPLFIVRMAPKNYIHEVQQAGGFTLVFKYQLYPFGQKAFAERVRRVLRLPADSPLRLSDGTVKRFLDWHLRQLGSGHK